MSRTLFLLLIIFSLLQQTTAAPLILKSKEKNLHFYYHDSLAFGHPVNFSGGETKIFITAPTLLFEADKNQTPFLVYPGETINITKDKEGYSVFTVEANPERTNELLFFSRVVKQTGSIYMSFPFHKYQSKADGLAEMQAFEKRIDELKMQRLSLLDSFSKQNKISDGFKEIAREMLLCTAIKDSILLLRNNRPLLENNYLYDKKLAGLIHTINHIPYSPFMFYLSMALLPVSVSINNNSIEFSGKSNSQINQAFEYIEANYSNTAREFLLARTIYSALNNNLTIPEKYLQKFYAECKDENYTRLVKNKIAELKMAGSLPKDRETLLLITGAKTDLETFVAKNSGKLIYLDFWASWCGPCRGEMGASKGLKHTFKGKDIVFAYISIDENLVDWKRASQEEDLVESNNFLLANAKQCKLINQYKIFQIPRYLLIGKNGKIILKDAPRPSDDTIIKVIKKYL